MLNKADVARTIKLHGQGLNDSEIAARLNLTPTAIAYRRRVLGLPANRSRTRLAMMLAEEGQDAED